MLHKESIHRFIIICKIVFIRFPIHGKSKKRLYRFSYLAIVAPLLQEGHNQQLVCLPEVVPIQQEGYKEGILKTVSPMEVHAEMLLHLCMGTKPEY